MAERVEHRRVLVFTAPVLLGDGVRVLGHPGGTRLRLDVVRSSTTGTWYRVGALS